MPDSFIPIGFNLDGYIIQDNSNANTNAEGSAIIGNDGSNGVLLENGIYLKDDTLKQVLMQPSVFGSTLLQITNDEGKIEYVSLSDQTNLKDGKLSFGGVTCTDLPAEETRAEEKIKELTNLLSSYEDKRSDFICGVGINAKFIVDYFNHFFNLNVTANDHIFPLLKQHLINAEVLFGVGTTQGKAFRFKVVYDLGGTDNTLKIMSSILLSNGFKDVISFVHDSLGEVNTNNKIKFPWADTKYDYNKASIPGFSPKDITNKTNNEISSFINLNDKIKAKWKAPVTNETVANVRVRFFIDKSKENEAKQIIPNCPAEIFNTNYADQALAEIKNISSDLELSGELQADIVSTAKYILEFCKSTNSILYGAHKSGGKTVFDGGGGFIPKSASQDTEFWNSYKGKYVLKKNNAWNGKAYHTDCSHFVTWVLNEVGAISATSQYGSGAYCAGSFKLNPGYKLQKITNVADVMPGDILGWNMGSRHHAGIAAIAGNAGRHYGAGGDGYLISKQTQGYAGVSSPKAIPGNDQQANHIWRIIKTS